MTVTWHRIVFIIFSIALLGLSACDRRLEIMRGIVEQRLSAVDSLFVARPNLSPDGRYLVFDVEERYLRENQHLWSSGSTYIALYDLKEGALEILAPFGKLVGTNSASFDFSGRNLVFATTCAARAHCTKEWLGNHIFSMSLSTRKTERLSTPGARHQMWWFSSSPKKFKRMLNPVKAESLVKGFPIYSPNNMSVYYYFTFISGSTVFGDSAWEHAELRRLRKTSEKGTVRWVEEPAITEDRGVAMFENLGLLSMLQDGRLLMPVGKPHGMLSKKYRKDKVSAYFFNPLSEQLDVAFDKSNVPEAINPSNKFHQFHSYYHSASHDGRRISFNRAQGKFVSLWENGKVRDILTHKDLGLTRISYTSLSGDGKWLIIFPHRNQIEDRQGVIWRMNIDSGIIQEIPLLAPLRRAMDRQQLSGHNQ